jgi:hypothetical protein
LDEFSQDWEWKAALNEVIAAQDLAR